MADEKNTLNIVIDSSKAKSGADDVTQSINSIIAATSKLNSNVNVTVKNLDDLGKSSNNSSKMVDQLSNSWRNLKALLAVGFAVKVFDSFIDKIITTDRSYQQFIASMYVSTKSIEQSKQAFSFVANAARAYGVELETLSNSYAKFRASVSGSLPTPAIDRMFLAITAVSSVLHKAPQDVDRMFKALTQMASKGQVMSEELKGQLGEHMPGAIAIAAQAMKVSVRQLIDQMKAGTVDIRKFFLNMPEEIMKRFGDAAKISSQSIIAQINNLKSTVFQMFVEMNSNGATVGLSKFIQAIDSKLQPASASFKAFGQVVGQAFLKAADFVNSLTPEQVGEFASKVIEAVSALIQIVAWLSQAAVWTVKNSELVVNLAEAYIALRVALVGASIASAGAVASSSAAGTAMMALGRVIIWLAALVAAWKLIEILREKFFFFDAFCLYLEQRSEKVVTNLGIVISNIFTLVSNGMKLMAQESINRLSAWSTSIINIVPGVNIKAPKVNFADDASSKISGVFSKIGQNNDAISRKYDKKYKDSIGAHFGNKDTSQIDSESAKAQSQIDQINKLMGEFEANKKLAEDALKGMDVEKPKQKGDPIGKASREYISYIDTMTKNLKQEFDDKNKLIDESVAAENISATQGYQQKIDYLKRYTEATRSEILKTVDLGHLNAKQKATIQGKLLDLDRDYQNKLLELQNKEKKERKEYMKEISSVEETYGAVRLTNLEKFTRDWNEKYAKYVKRAAQEGDTDTLDKLNKSARLGAAKASYRSDNSDGYSDFEAAHDLVSNNQKMFVNDTGMMAASVIGEYETMFKNLGDLQRQGTLDTATANKVQTTLMLERAKAIRDATVTAAQSSVDLGNSSNLDQWVAMLGKVADGFTNIGTEGTKAMVSLGETLASSVSSNLTSVIKGTETWQQGLANIGDTILNTIIESIVQMGVKWAANAIMTSMLSKASSADAVATAATTGAAITSSMAPAAAATSMATAGANTVTASTGMLAFGAVMAAMLGGLMAGAFDSGGFIPEGKIGLVGEHGPEFISGPYNVTGRKSTESIISSAVAGSASGSSQSSSGNDNSVKVYVTVNKDGSSDVSTSSDSAAMREMGQKMANVAKKVIRDELRQGGYIDGRR